MALRRWCWQYAHAHAHVDAREPRLARAKGLSWRNLEQVQGRLCLLIRQKVSVNCSICHSIFISGIGSNIDIGSWLVGRKGELDAIISGKVRVLYCKCNVLSSS